MSDLVEDFISFLHESPTAWHTVQAVGERLASVDFSPLEEENVWKLKKGESYFVQRGGSICAFHLPKEKPSNLRLIGAHTDSPALKIKPNPDIQDGPFHQLAVEIYGAPILSSWFNRDLAIAGRLVVENGQNRVEEKLIFLDEAPLIIPQIAIHLEREMNEKGGLLDKQDHLRPILTVTPSDEPQLLPLLKQYADFKTLLAFDLFLVPLEAPRLVGIKGEMLASYRLDNLASSHACMTAIASAKVAPSTVAMAVLWDAEEVGSESAEGAASSFVVDTLKRIQHFYGLSEEEWLCLKASSLGVSVDVSHAYNPNYPKKYDPNHHSIPGQGVVIKYHAGKNYITDGKTAAEIVALCRALKLPYQSYATRSDMKSGSTIGPIFAKQMGIKTVDIGSPLLSMHSIREVISIQDHLQLCHLLTQLLSR